MTWTSAVGKYCGILLYKIVDGLALTRISPNVLTFIGLVINVIAALFFGALSYGGLVINQRVPKELVEALQGSFAEILAVKREHTPSEAGA